MNTIAVMGDAHVDDEQDLSRFSIAGRWLLDNKPSHIILIGDFLTFNCLSAWDKDKRKRMEGKRYASEIAAGNEALDLLMAPINNYNEKKKRSKSKQYTPVWVYIYGNHEDRLDRYLDYDPTFLGAVSVSKDLRLKERGFVEVPYREWYYVNGIGFTHIPHNKISPIGGVDITRKAQAVTVSSCVFGHTHEQHLSHVHKEGMPHLQDTYNCGAFISKKEDYVHGRVTNYWRGLSLLHNWKEGRFDVESYSLSRLERMYD